MPRSMRSVSLGSVVLVMLDAGWVRVKGFTIRAFRLPLFSEEIQ
jgi:hypothetical protein